MTRGWLVARTWLGLELDSVYGTTPKRGLYFYMAKKVIKLAWFVISATFIFSNVQSTKGSIPYKIDTLFQSKADTFEARFKILREEKWTVFQCNFEHSKTDGWRYSIYRMLSILPKKEK
jgi:hypothetical protein